MLFAWDEHNREHLAKHDVSPDEAEQIVVGARPPFPMDAGDGKFMVWGQTATGRFLQVVFASKSPQEVAYESLSMEAWSEVEAGKVLRITRIVHSMDLTPAMKARLRRFWR